MIYLRFSTEKYSLLSALIRWRTEAKISHVELFNDVARLTLGARFSLRGKFGRWQGIAAWPLDGVQFRTEWANRKQSNVRMVSVPWAQEAWDWIIKNELYKPYDWRGILGIVSSHGECSQNACFCSELIVKFLLATNRWPYALSPQATTPRDLFVLLSLPR